MDRKLVIGMNGPDVADAQRRLNVIPPTALPALDMDGVFGPKTHARVREFQKSSSLIADGVVGPLTWKALREKTPAPPPAVATECPCGNCDPRNQVLARAMQQKFLTLNPSPSGTKKSFLPALITAGAVAALGKAAGVVLPTNVKQIDATQISTADPVFGTSLDYTKIFISDGKGISGRPFTVAVTIPLIGTFVVINCGTFTPGPKTLIHELVHAWQSQHHSNPQQYMTNAVTSQAAALGLSGVAAVSDPTVKSHPDFKDGQYPFSAYAYTPSTATATRSFATYAAEQIANLVDHGDATIRAKIRGAAKNTVDAENVLSLMAPKTDDRRVAGVVF